MQPANIKASPQINLYQLVRQYDAAAPNWQKVIRFLGFDRAYDKTFKHINHLGLKSGAHVLDAGIGSGALSLALAQEVDRLKVTGADIAPKMLTEAEHTLFGRVASCAVVQADVRRLLFPDECFDAVISAHLLEHFTDPSAALAELYRVLRPGAPFFVMVTQQGLSGSWMQRTWPIHPLTPHGLVRLLEQAGFRKVGLVPVKGPPWCHLMSLAALGWKAVEAEYAPL